MFSYASGGGSTSAAAASDNFVATSRHHSDDEAAVEASSEPRKKERKLLQVPGGSAPRELADLARLRQSLRTKMSPPLALTWSWAIFFLRKTRESQSHRGRTYSTLPCTYFLLRSDGRNILQSLLLPQTTVRNFLPYFATYLCISFLCECLHLKARIFNENVFKLGSIRFADTL